MKKRIPVAVTVVLVLLFVIITFQITYIAIDNKYDETIKKLSEKTELEKRLSELVTLYDELYIGDIDEDAAINGVLSGFVNSIDKYGTYMTEEAYAEMMTDYNAELEGIGVHAVYNTDYKCIEIINVMPDSPALEAGIEPGDLIVYVGDEAVSDIGYYPAINMIRGERGTYTQFTVYRGEDYSEIIEFNIMRDVVKEQTVVYSILESSPKIGHISIFSFDAGTAEQFIASVEAMRDAGCDKLILDVRNNPGGLLTSITAVLDYLLPEGPIVRMIDNSGTEEVINSDASCVDDMEMVVLCNGGTASAAELFTSAMKDYDAAVVIGVTTYGKGTVQSIRTLAGGGAISISYKLYSPPYSDNFEGIGVEPDITVEMAEEYRGMNLFKVPVEGDTQLQHAIAVLTGDE